MTQETINGWIARDASGDLYLGLKEPMLEVDGEYWVNYGQSMRLDDKLFPEITLQNSPWDVEIKINIMGDVIAEPIKQRIEVDNNAPALLKLPCVWSVDKRFEGDFLCFLRTKNGNDNAKIGDHIIEDANGDWFVEHKVERDHD